jgi:hypothetical protein
MSFKEASEGRASNFGGGLASQQVGSGKQAATKRAGSKICFFLL